MPDLFPRNGERSAVEFKISQNQSDGWENLAHSQLPQQGKFSAFILVNRTLPMNIFRAVFRVQPVDFTIFYDGKSHENSAGRLTRDHPTEKNRHSRQLPS